MLAQLRSPPVEEVVFFVFFSSPASSQQANLPDWAALDYLLTQAPLASLHSLCFHNCGHLGLDTVTGLLAEMLPLCHQAGVLRVVQHATPDVS